MNGWYLEVDHPTSGNTLRPRILEGVQRVPSANGLPTARIPVPPDAVSGRTKWAEADLEQATARLWFEGERQPIDELSSVTTREDKVVLECRGGTELLQKVSKDYSAEEVHVAAENLIQNETTYTANVDTPSSTVETDVTQQSPDSQSELESLLSIADDEPLAVDSGKVNVQQTCFTTEAENADREEGGIEALSASRFSGGAAEVFDADGEALEFDFTLAHDIPAGEFELQIRWDGESATDQGDVDWSLDGTDLGSFNGAATDVGWRGLIQSKGHLTDPGRVESGDHTLRVAASGTWNGGDFQLDLVAPLDNRYSYTFDNTTDSDGWLSGPELYPDAEPAEFQDEIPLRAVSGANVSVTIDDTSNGQALEVSNDKSDTYASKSNASSFDHDFSDLGVAVRFRAQLSRYGSRTTATPTQGFQGQQLDAYTLEADLDDTPLVASRSFDTTILEVLQALAEISGDVFAVEQTPQETSVEWTQVGARSRSDPIEPAGFQVEKSMADVHEKVTIYGASQRRRAEQWTANHGTFVDLEQDNLQPGKEVVYDPSDGTQYAMNVDYEMDFRNGQVKALPGGGIADGASVEISYHWQPKASYTASGVTDPVQPLVETIPSVSSDRACYQAARSIVDIAKDPVRQGEVRLPADRVGWSVVEETALLDVDTNGVKLQIREVKAGPGEVVLKLENRRSAGDFIRQLAAKARGAAEKV